MFHLVVLLFDRLAFGGGRASALLFELDMVFLFFEWHILKDGLMLNNLKLGFEVLSTARMATRVASTAWIGHSEIGILYLNAW